MNGGKKLNFSETRWVQITLLTSVLTAALWLFLAEKPWHTKVFLVELARKDIPLSHYITAGVWIGILGACLAALLLAATAGLWNRQGDSKVRQLTVSTDTLSRRWFILGLSVIVVFAAWQRWSAMSHSFWGDEGWAFCDFVHGKWKPITPDGSRQGDLKFEKVRWLQTIFGDRSGNNHWLGSILQRVCLDSWQWWGGRQSWDFDERVVRLVPLLAGLGSLVALGFLARRLGGSALGLSSAAVMALHPQHLRFSIEARGYSLMLFFFILALLAILRAAESGRRRDWLLFGTLQFLVLYSWKGAIYPLAALNLTFAAWLLFSRQSISGQTRTTALARWFAANLIGAMFFLPLTVSSNLQIAKTIDEIRRHAKPMDAHWARDAVAENLLGMPWHEQDHSNPYEVSVTRLCSENALAAVAACAVVAALGVGLWRLWRRDKLAALMFASILVSGIAAALHFKYLLKVELLTWYLLFNVPIVALILARAITPQAHHSYSRHALAVLGLTAFGTFCWPKTLYFQNFPRENHKRAWELTRGAHEPRGYSGPSKVLTAWLWRHTHTYDSRGDTDVRTAATLAAKMQEARANGGEFYFVVGIRELSAMVCGDVMAVLHDPSQFQHVETLWGAESLNTLEVYRMLPSPSAPTPNPASN